MTHELDPAWLPTHCNRGPWAVHYTAPQLLARMGECEVVLPLCSLDTPWEQIAAVGKLVLPPLFFEGFAGDVALEEAIVQRVFECWPLHRLSRRRVATHVRLRVVRVSTGERKRAATIEQPKVIALSADTAVEEHGPHLPLATDRLQSYAILQQAAHGLAGVQVVAPIDYGHLLWGLGFGLSIDIPPALLVPYVTRVIDAQVARTGAAAVYLTDTHGSPPHRAALQDALQATRAPTHRLFRWLHEPLQDVAWNRGDAHAGGVETAMIEHIHPHLVDATWWPTRREELSRDSMSFTQMAAMKGDLTQLLAHGDSTTWNGIVGSIENYDAVRGRDLMNRAVQQARADLQSLLQQCT